MKNINIFKDKRGAINFPPEKKRALMIIRNEILSASRNYLSEEGFYEVVVPHITKATGACENPDTLFEVNYFDDKLNPYLSQTGQLYLEIAVPILKKVWCYGPSFRKEEKVDYRHLTEFTLLEFEFCGDFNQLLYIIENLIKTMINSALQCKEELELFNVDFEKLEAIMNTPFNKIRYDEAIRILNLKWGDDFSSNHEKKLLTLFDNNPIFITHFPEKIKFFNMKINSNNPKVVNSADLILPFGGEAVGAAERECKYEVVEKKLKNSNMFKLLIKKGREIDDFEWYLSSLKENENCPHAGCGIGIERVLQFILANDDIHHSSLFSLDRENVF